MSEYDEINIDDIRLSNRPASPAPVKAPAEEPSQEPTAVSGTFDDDEIICAVNRNRPETAEIIMDVPDKCAEPEEPPADDIVLRRPAAAAPAAPVPTPAAAPVSAPVTSGQNKPLPRIKGTTIPDSGLLSLPKFGKKKDAAPVGSAVPDSADDKSETAKAIPELKKPAAAVVPPADIPETDKKKRPAASPATPPQGKSAAPPPVQSRLKPPPASITSPKMPDIKQENYVKGCLIFLLAAAIILGGSGYLIKEHWQTIRPYMAKFEKWMSDHNLAFDGGDAPWKHQAAEESKKEAAPKKSKPAPPVTSSVNYGGGSGSTVYGKALRHASDSAEKHSKPREIPDMK